MEAAAVPAAAEPSAPEATPEATPEVTPDPWQGHVESRLGEMGDTMRQLLERMPQPEAEPEPDWSAQLNDLYADPQGPDPQQLEQIIAQRVEHGIKQATAPLSEEFGALKQTITNQEIDGLAVQHPELQDEKIAAQAIQKAWELADATGARSLSAPLIRTAYFAMKGEELAGSQTAAPGPGPAAQLEQGGGGSPTPAAEPTRWDQIKNSGTPQGQAIF